MPWVKRPATIFVVRQDGVQYLHPLPLGRKALEARVREFMEPLINSQAGGFSLPKGQELYDLLLAKPLATVAPGEQVIIVPDGILGLLPFEALVIAAGPNPETSIFVGDQRTLRYYPSAAVLAQQRGRADKPTTRPLLALGNPIYYAEEERSQANKKKKAEKNDPSSAGQDRSHHPVIRPWPPIWPGVQPPGERPETRDCSILPCRKPSQRFRKLPRSSKLSPNHRMCFWAGRPMRPNCARPHCRNTAICTLPPIPT